MSHEYFFVLLSAIAAFIRYGTYTLSVWRKKTRPHCFSWFVWSFMIGIGALAQFKLGGGPSVWGLIIVAGTCFIIAFWSLFVGEKNITRSDWVALGCAITTMVLWKMTDDARIAIMLLLLFDIFSFWPTLRKCWYDPWSEPPASTFWSGLRYFFLLFAIPHPTLENEIYPFWLMAADWMFMAYIIGRRRMSAKSQQRDEIVPAS